MNWIWLIAGGLIILILLLQAWGGYLVMRNRAREMEVERNEVLGMLRLVIMDDIESPGMDEDYITELRWRVKNEQETSVVSLYEAVKNKKEES